MEHMESQLETQPLGLSRALFQWLRDSLQNRGLWGTTRNFAEQLGLFIRDSFPDRRRSRFGDIDYDFDYGVDTTWARLPLGVRIRELFSERLYQPTDPAEFHNVISHVPADFRKLAFIDLGSGKGRALLLASEYPFREIVGVEVQPELHRIAQENIDRFSSDKRKCHRITAYCMDARDFTFPDEPMLIYLFNPFPDYVMESVLKNLREALQKSPRETFVLYNTPWDERVFARDEFLEKVYEQHNFQVYKSRL